MWDEARIFTTNKKLKEGVKTVKINGELMLEEKIGDDVLKILYNK